MTLSEISVLIKTFERPRSLKALLRSLQHHCPQCPVLVADDGRDNLEQQLRLEFPRLRLSYFHLPFDTGLSAGRNYLVQRTTTPYFVLCDDDFVFDKRADIERAVECLQSGALDIVGGDFYNYIKIMNVETFLRHAKRPANMFQFITNRFKISRYIGNFQIDGTHCVLSVSQKAPPSSPWPCDLVNNFFVARTAAISELGGWDPELKLGEHEDFFLKAKQRGLKVVYLPGFGTRHYPVIKSDYKKYRIRALQFKKLFVKKNGFTSYRETNADTGEILFEI